MIHLYYIILLVITAVGTSIATFYAPTLIAKYNAYKTRIKHTRQQALRDIIKEEIKNVLLELKNN